MELVKSLSCICTNCGRKADTIAVQSPVASINKIN